MNSTKGQLEASISEALVKFEKEYMGRGPVETKTHIIEDLIFIRFKGVLTPAEKQLAKSAEGAELIKRTRLRLVEGARPLLESLINDITGAILVSLHTDISAKTGERIIVFTMNKNIIS